MLKVTEEFFFYLATRPSQRKVVVVVVVVGGGSPVTRGEEGSVAHTSVSQSGQKQGEQTTRSAPDDRPLRPASLYTQNCIQVTP